MPGRPLSRAVARRRARGGLDAAADRAQHGLNDVRMLPREAAQRKGKRTVEQILAAAVAERGCYPEAVGVVLWGSEVLESDGVGIAQALDLMGARVAKDRFNRAERVELISLDQLGRPRIDILGNSSVVFKKTSPGAVRLIARGGEISARSCVLTTQTSG